MIELAESKVVVDRAATLLVLGIVDPLVTKALLGALVGAAGFPGSNVELPVQKLVPAVGCKEDDVGSNERAAASAQFDCKESLKTRIEKLG
jgi:hypothetical protein